MVQLKILPKACDDLGNLSWSSLVAHFGEDIDATQFLFKLSYDVVNGECVVGGTRLPFPAGGPGRNYAAIFDTSPVFDAVRMNLLQNDRGPSGLEEFMVILMTQIESLDDITELTEVISFIEKYRAWHEARPTEEDRPFPDFVRRVWPSYLKTLQNSNYYLEVREVLCLAAFADINVIVLLSKGEQVTAEGAYLGADSVVKFVQLVGNENGGAVRSHFERTFPHLPVPPVLPDPRGKRQRRSPPIDGWHPAGKLFKWKFK